MRIAHAEKVSKTYEQAGAPIEVLRGLELEISPGETVAILGQSGSGKSTLLSLLAGLDRPTSGAVRIAGQDLAALGESELARFRASRIGIVFQQFHLLAHLTALENVALPLEIIRDAGAQERAAQLLGRVGLSHRLEHQSAQLSGGEKQRVAIARAIAARPALLLADEPSGNLDVRTGVDVMNALFEQVRLEKMALLLVTHDEGLAARCDRTLRLLDGKLVAATPEA